MAYLPDNPDYQVEAPSAGVDPTVPAPAVKTPGSQIQQWYQQYLGRAPENTGVVDAWSGQDAATAQSGIQNSAEGKAYAAAHPSGLAGAAGAIGAAGAGLAQPAFGRTGGAISTAQGANPALQQLRDLLMSKATQSENVDPNDPNVQQATDAYAADQTRAGRNFLTHAAEAAGPYGSTNAETRHAAEVVGRNTGDYRGKLMQSIADARRTQIAQALQGLGGAISEEDATRLRQEDQDLARQQFGANTAQQSFEDQYRTIFG